MNNEIQLVEFSKFEIKELLEVLESYKAIMDISRMKVKTQLEQETLVKQGYKIKKYIDKLKERN